MERRSTSSLGNPTSCDHAGAHSRLFVKAEHRFTESECRHGCSASCRATCTRFHWKGYEPVQRAERLLQFHRKGEQGTFRLRFDVPKRHSIRALEPDQEVYGAIVKCVRWVMFATLLLSSLPCSDASVLRWITRLGHTNCDNHPVAESHPPGLIQRLEQKDVDAPLQFEVERPFASHSSLRWLFATAIFISSRTLILTS